MQPDIKTIMADVRAYAAMHGASQPLAGLLSDLVDVIARQQAQIDSLRATRPRTIHEDPPGVRLTT